MGIFGKSRDASDPEKQLLANEWKNQAAEAEIEAIGKSKAEQEEAANRAAAMRREANRLNPDK
jgi:hypothetical protein